MNAAQLASMRMGANMAAGGVGVGIGGGMMGPPVLPRTPHEMLGNVNGMPGVNGMGPMGMNMAMVNGGLSRQPSVADLAMRSAAGTPGASAGAAGLSINTNTIGLGGPQQQQMAAMLGGTPTSASPNPALLGMGVGVGEGGTPRQSSQPPAAGSGGSPFAGMGMVGLPGMERKISGQGGLLAHAQPMQRVPVSAAGNMTATGAVASSSSSAVGAPVQGQQPQQQQGQAQAQAQAQAQQGQGQAHAQQPAVIPSLPPLPAGVNLNPKVTRVTVVPLVQSDKAIPPLAADEIADVKTWMKVDREYEGMYKKMKERMAEELKEAMRVRPWYEKDPAEARLQQQQRRRGDGFALIGLKGSKEEKARRKNAKREGVKL